MIGFLVEPAERVAVRSRIDAAKRQHWVPDELGVIQVRSPAVLPERAPTVLALKHSLLREPLVDAWRRTHHQHRLVLLWPQTAHPQQVVEALRYAPDTWRTATFDDIAEQAFWQQLGVTRTARDLVREFAQQLLADAGHWHESARPMLQRLALNLDCASVQQIAGMLYGAQDPGHTLRRRVRAPGHAPPKVLLMAAQLAAWRYAVEQGAGTVDAARAVGRPTLESWRRSVRDTLGREADAYLQGQTPAQWYTDRARALYAAHSGNTLADTSLPVLFAKAE